MGWRQALRQIEAQKKAKERAELRQIREHARMRKEIVKMEAKERAAFEVEVYETKLKQILSVHQDCGVQIDWHNILQLSSPPTPQKNDRSEAAALLRQEGYSPSIIDWFLRRTESKRIRLEEEVIEARLRDEKEFQEQMKLYELSYSDWHEFNDLAKRIVAGNTAYYGKAFRELCRLDELNELGSKINLSFDIPNQCNVTFAVNGDKAIPCDSKSLSKKGELIVKKIPLSRFNELYQDFVIGSVLRIAREIFAALPLKIVCITVFSDLLDSSTGYVTNQPILSAQIPLSTLTAFKFEALDPSNSLRHFNHKIAFNKTKGFSAIQLNS